MITTEKLLQRQKLIDDIGINKASEVLKVKKETLERGIRELARISKLKETKLKVLVLDIETAPSRAYVWNFWKANIGKDQVISDWFMISWAAKWLNNPDVMSDVLTPSEAKDEDDSRISASIHSLLDEADVVIAHNAKKFDLPKLNTRFLLNKLPKPSPYQTIDTLLVARKQFGFNSNSLDSICRQLNIDGKVDTGGMSLWTRCMAGDEYALKDMLQYNENDVIILEDVYDAIKGWIPNHPRLYGDVLGDTCEVCGSKHIVENGEYRTTVNKYKSYSCLSCGSSLKDRNNSSNNSELTVCAR